MLGLATYAQVQRFSDKEKSLRNLSGSSQGPARVA
jgi:hypothetical protein